MTRFLLDTNIVSNATKPSPSANLLDWLRDRADEDLFISTITIGEIWRGVLELPAGRRRGELERWYAGPEGPPALFAGRILGFDDRAAMAWAQLMADGRAANRPRSAIDMMIAAIAVTNDCFVATANERHFERIVPYFNPMGG